MFMEVGSVVNSTELMVVRDALLHVHKAFYEKVESGMTALSTADVIRGIRSHVLNAKVVYFDGLLQNEVRLQVGCEK